MHTNRIQPQCSTFSVFYPSISASVLRQANAERREYQEELQDLEIRTDVRTNSDEDFSFGNDATLTRDKIQ